jgi:hypothetical protein
MTLALSKGSLLTLAGSAVVSGMLFGASPVSAAVALSACLSANDGSHEFGPNPTTCTTTETENSIKLSDGKDVPSSTGAIKDVPGVTVDFSAPLGSGDTYDFSSGDSTIKPSHASGASSFGGLDVSIENGFRFDDLEFHLQMTETGSSGSDDIENLTVTWGTSVGDTFTYNNLKPATDLDFFLVSPTPITFVDLSSTTGIDEAKQFSISSVSGIPELSTWAMMGLGFAGLGFAGYYRHRKLAIAA